MLRSSLCITAVAFTLVACDRMPTNPSPTVGTTGTQPASNVNTLRGVADIVTDSNGVASIILSATDGRAYRLIGPKAEAALAAAGGREIVVAGELTSSDLYSDLYVETYLLIEETNDCMTTHRDPTDNTVCPIEVMSRRARRQP